MIKKVNPVVEVLPISEGATTDPNNTNLHTQRGRGLHENSMRKRGAGRSIFSAGKGVDIPVTIGGLFLFVYFFMAIFANSQSIINIKSTFWIFSPFFYVMGAEFPAFDITFLASIVIAFENIGTPFFIFIPTHCGFSCTSIAFISRVQFSLLKMFRTSPIFRGGAFFYPLKKFYSKLWIFVKRGLLFTDFIISYIRTPRTFLRTIIIIFCRGCSKFISTIQAFFYKWWMSAFPRAILSSPIFSFELAWQFIKNFSASLALQFNSGNSLFSFGIISAFMGTKLTHSVGNAIFGKLKFNSAILANSCNHFSCHFLFSKKVLPSRRAVLYLRQNQFSLSGSV
jgi:hypothetical protein